MSVIFNQQKTVMTTNIFFDHIQRTGGMDLKNSIINTTDINVVSITEGNAGDKYDDLFNNYKVIFHKIIKILDPEHRLESWQNNVGQTDRKVLLLSDEHFILDWKVWLLYCDGVNCQGTMIFRKGEVKLTNFIEKYKLL